MRHAAIAGVDSVAIGLADGPWTETFDALAGHAGERLMPADTDPGAGVEVLATDSG